MCILVLMNGYEQKVAGSIVDQRKVDKLLDFLAEYNTLDGNDQKLAKLNKDNNLNVEKRVRNLFLGRRATKLRNLFLG